jgi:hypothetical protein
MLPALREVFLCWFRRFLGLGIELAREEILYGSVNSQVWQPMGREESLFLWIDGFLVSCFLDCFRAEVLFLGWLAGSICSANLDIMPCHLEPFLFLSFDLSFQVGSLMMRESPLFPLIVQKVRARVSFIQLFSKDKEQVFPVPDKNGLARPS